MKLIRILILLVCPVIYSQTVTLTTRKAFPDLHGEGADNITGGRGGVKFFVNTLSSANIATEVPASGNDERHFTGSFLGWAMLNEAAEGIPVVSGNVTVDVVTLNSTTNNKTWHGHLAPEGGFGLINSKVMIQNAQNWVFRYLTIRDGTGSVLRQDDALFLNRSSKIALDHLSLGWAGDEMLNAYTGGAGQVTYSDIIFQRLIIGQGRDTHNRGAQFGNSTTAEGDLIITGHLNFYAATFARTPNVFAQSATEGRFTNDVVYGWVGRTMNIGRAPQIDAYNSYFKPSPDTVPVGVNMLHQYQDVGGGPPSLYSAGNHVEGYLTNPAADNTQAGGMWSEFDNFNSTLLSSGWFRGSALSIDANVGYTPVTALNALKTVITDKDVGNCRATNSSGAEVFYHDSVDEGYFTAFNAGTSSVVAESSWSHPSRASNTAYTDTSPINGIDDTFETTHSITSSGDVITNWTIDGISITNNAGYTAFEMWSAYRAGDFERLKTTVAVTGVTWDNDTQTIGTGQTVDLSHTITPENASDKGVTYSSDNTGVLSNAGVWVSAGSANLTVTTDDGSFTDVMAVTCSAASIPVTGVSITPATASINTGGTTDLTESYTPSDATDKTGTWTSSNTNLATVNSSGLVTGVSHSNDLVENGDFSSSSGWVEEVAAWTISGGVAACDGTHPDARSVYQNIGAELGKSYFVTFTVKNRTAGGVRAYVGGADSGPLVSANGTYTHAITVETLFDANLWMQGTADFVGEIDDVAVFEFPLITYTTNDGGFTDTTEITVNQNANVSVTGNSYGDPYYYSNSVKKRIN